MKFFLIKMKAVFRRTSTGQLIQRLLVLNLREIVVFQSSVAVHHRCSAKKVFLKLLRTYKETEYWSLFVIKIQIAYLQLYEKKDSHTDVPWAFCTKFSMTLFFLEHLLATSSESFQLLFIRWNLTLSVWRGSQNIFDSQKYF